MVGLHEKFWAKKRTEKKHTRERTALAEHAHELARLAIEEYMLRVRVS